MGKETGSVSVHYGIGSLWEILDKSNTLYTNTKVKQPTICGQPLREWKKQN